MKNNSNKIYLYGYSNCLGIVIKGFELSEKEANTRISELTENQKWRNNIEYWVRPMRQSKSPLKSNSRKSRSRSNLLLEPKS